MKIANELTSVIEVMNNFKALWLGNPEIRSANNILRDLLIRAELIHSLIIEGNVHTHNSQICKQEMALQAIALSDAIITQQKIKSHKTAFPYSYADIYLAPAKIAAFRSQEICNYTMSLISVLKEYDIRKTDVEQLQLAIDKYLSHVQKEIITEKDYSTYNDALAGIYQEANSILINRLDIYIKQYINSNPEFYNAYHTTRNSHSN